MNTPTSRLRFDRTPLLPVAICFTYCLQLLIVAQTAYHGVPGADVHLNYFLGTKPMIDWQTKIPIRLSQPEVISSALVWPLFAIIGLLQSYMLYRFDRRARCGALHAAVLRAVIVSVMIMALASLALPAETSADSYAYVGYGLAPTLHSSFDTKNLVFPGEFGVIADMYGRPLTPNVYGAGFYGLMSFVRLSHAPLVVDLYALRLMGLLGFMAILYFLSRRLPKASIATLALCPALHFEWILNSHNDIWPILCTIIALTLIPSRVGLAIVAICCAALLKFSLLPVGISTLALRRNLIQRLALACITVVLAITAIVALDGRSLIGAVAPHLADTTIRAGQSLSSAAVTTRAKHDFKVRAVMYLAIASTVVLALLVRRGTAGNSFLFTALAPAGFAWYFTWGLAYAALTPETFAVVPVSLSAIFAFFELQPKTAVQGNLVAWSFALTLALVFAVMRRNQLIVQEGQS